MNNITIRGITLTLEEEREVFMHYQLQCVYYFVDDRLNECDIALDEDMLTDWVKEIVGKKIYDDLDEERAIEETIGFYLEPDDEEKFLMYERY